MSNQHPTLASLLASYLPCSASVTSCFRTPSSPPLSPMQGELDGLLNDDERWRDEMDDAVSLHSTRRKSSYAAPKPRGYLAKHMSLFGRSPSSSARRDQPPAYTSRPDPATSAIPDQAEDAEQSQEYDEDAASLERATLDKLPELAKRFEPQLTLEDIAREEAEQARRERLAERASGLEIYSPPALDNAEADEFGGFEQGPAQSTFRALPDTGSDSDEEAAEVSFGLGTAD